MQFIASLIAVIVSAGLIIAAPVDTDNGLVRRAQFSGDMTYYDPSIGAGSCGWVAGKYDAVVSVNHGDMANGANPNLNPHCGRNINIYKEDGTTVTAKVVDTCPVCVPGAIDVSESVFKAVRPNGDGRVHNVAWDWA